MTNVRTWAAVILATTTVPAFAAGELGDYRCSLDSVTKEQMSEEHRQLVVDVRTGLAVHFFPSWSLASSDPDLRPGYAVTCERDLSRFRQTKSRTKGEVLLRYQPNEYEQDHRGCEVRIVEGTRALQVVSSGCAYQCLNLNLSLPKDGQVCKVWK